MENKWRADGAENPNFPQIAGHSLFRLVLQDEMEQQMVGTRCTNAYVRTINCKGFAYI